MKKEKKQISRKKSRVKTVIILIAPNQQLGENMRVEDTSLLRDSFSSYFHGTMLTDIWRFVGAIWTVLLPVAAPAFGDTGHLVLTYKLLRAAGLGLVISFGS